jgi:YD repeat-containing protein
MTNAQGQLIVDYDYDAAGRLQRKTLGNGVFTTYGYNSAGQVLDLFNHKPDGSLLSRYEYDYDASGRRTAMRVARGYTLANGPPATEAQIYGYDAFGQLTRVEYGDGRVVEYVYDAAGNRTEVKDNGASTIYTPNALNQYTTVGDEVLLYDADGNLTNRHSTLNLQLSTSYIYDIENRLIGVTTPTNSWSYSYDAFGNRIATMHNGVDTRFVIDPSGARDVVSEYDGSGNVVAKYEHGLGLLSRAEPSGAVAQYTFAAVGSTSELTDGTGEVVNSYAYDAFGLPLGRSELLPI